MVEVRITQPSPHGTCYYCILDRWRYKVWPESWGQWPVVCCRALRGEWRPADRHEVHQLMMMMMMMMMMMILAVELHPNNMTTVRTV